MAPFVHSVPARAGILGNPSDGYGGRTLAITVDHFAATVTLTPSPGTITILPSADDGWTWPSATEMAAHIDRHGYGTGQQLLAAVVRTFFSVAESRDHDLPDGFTLSYETSIPRQVGLGGSSALVIATLRCLCDYTGLELPDPVLASIALSCETSQLGITAGLQDRVVQTYGGLVSMDFGRMKVDTQFGVQYGDYARVDAGGLPPLFLAYRLDAAEPSGDYHRRLRERFESGDGFVRDTLRDLAVLVLEGRAALRWGDHEHFSQLVAKNMRLRRSLGPLPAHQEELVAIADAEGAPATFAGSGGAVIGTYSDHDHFDRLVKAYASIDAPVVAVNRSSNNDHDQPKPSAGLSPPALAVVEPLRPRSTS